jgi:hypothetical protein
MQADGFRNLTHALLQVNLSVYVLDCSISNLISDANFHTSGITMRSSIYTALRPDFPCVGHPEGSQRGVREAAIGFLVSTFSWPFDGKHL